MATIAISNIARIGSVLSSTITNTTPQLLGLDYLKFICALESIILYFTNNLNKPNYYYHYL